MAITTNAKDELYIVSKYAVSHGRRKMSKQLMNNIKRSYFLSVNSAQDCIRSAARSLVRHLCKHFTAKGSSVLAQAFSSAIYPYSEVQEIKHSDQISLT